MPTVISGTSLIIGGDLSVTGNSTLGDAASDLLNIGSGGIVKDAAGNIGIGVTPSAWHTDYKIMDIGPTGSIHGRISSQDTSIGTNTYRAVGGAWTYKTTNLAALYTQSVGTHNWYTASFGTVGNAITWTTVLSINAGGFMSSTTTTANEWCRLMSHTATGSGATGPYGAYVSYANASPNGNDNWFYNAGDNTAQRFGVKSNGGISNFSANNANLSDERLKTNWQPAPSYYSRWLQIDFRTFLYKDQTDTEPNLGVSAQQLESICPELIDNSGFGKAPEGEAPYKAVYQTDFQYATAVALQEAIKKIEVLEARLATLEGVK